MKLIISIFFVSIFCTYNAYPTSIRVVNLNLLIENNEYLNKLIENIEEEQIVYKNKFNENEEYLKNKLDELDELRLILDDSELENEINLYNQELNDFNIKINSFNNHYENQINQFKNKILQSIIEILKKYSLDNEIDLILDSNSYILSTNSINITELISKELSKLNFNISFEKYK